MEQGTLDELDAKPGDVVECVGWEDGDDMFVGSVYTIKDRYKDMVGIFAVRDGSWASGDGGQLFRIVSRANTTKLWRDNTPEEKGALLLAHHEGEVIEWSYGLPWETAASTKDNLYPMWSDNSAYRVKPTPKRETVTSREMYITPGGCIAANAKIPGARPVVITYDRIDGDIDPETFRVSAR